MLNKNELILERVRALVANDLTTGELLFRLTSLEEPTLQCTTEGDEIVDALGSLITTLYRAKRATFTATNSLLSLDLASKQFGATKEVADADSKIIDYTYEILDISEGKVTLMHEPSNEIKFIYSVESGEIGTAYKAGGSVTATDFTVDKTAKQITVPTGLTGKVYVEYEFENENAMRIVNKTSEYPEACSIKLFVRFKDKCNENIVYSGVIIAPKAKLNPEQVDLALTSTGQHPFEFTMMKDYCDEDGELFTIIVSQ